MSHRASARPPNLSPPPYADGDPLHDREIENLAQALRFIGYGVQSHTDECGNPISALAWTAIQRLSALREIWSKMIKASAGA